MASPPLPPSKQLQPEELKELARKTQSAVSDRDCEFMEHFPKEIQHKCPICLNVLQTPQITSCCGNKFCLKCMKSMRSTTCPICNRLGIRFFPDNYLERLINQRKVCCLLRNDGCDWTGELCNLESHLDTDRHKNNEMACQFLPVPCSYCTEYVRRRDMEAHMRQCLHRPSKCEFCFCNIGYNQLKDHYQICRACPVVCPNVICSKPMQAWELDSHVDKCSWSTLTCEYHHAGCEEKILRKDMERHLKANMQRHLDLVHKKLTKLEEEVKSRGRISFLVISDLPEDALSEHKLKSRFGQFGPVDRVQLLDKDLSAGIVIFSSADTYQKVIEKSRDRDIKLCKEYVQANPVYTTSTNQDSDTKDDDSIEIESLLSI